MEEEPGNMPPVQPAKQKPHENRFTRLLELFATVMLVSGLVVGFLVLFASRPQNRQGHFAYTSHPQVQPPGIFLAVSDMPSANGQGGTFKAYGLLAAKNTPIWSTFLVRSDRATGSVVVHNHLAYIPIANDIFALRVDTGSVVWKTTLPTDPHTPITLQVEGEVLVAGGQDANAVASLYRLNEQNGALLWRYETGADTAFALGNGVVYTGKDEVTSMFTPNPGRLRFLVALSAASGQVLWSQDHLDPLAISLQGSTIYVQSIAADTTGSDKRYFLSAWTSRGDKLWLETGLAQRPMVLESGLLVISTDSGSDLCAYRTENGHVAWCTHNPTQTVSPGGIPLTLGPSYTRYVAQNGVLYTTVSMQSASPFTHESTASLLQALNIQTGTVIWSQQVGTSESPLARKGSHISVDQIKSVGLQFGTSSVILLSQKTLSIVTYTGISTFSLADGQLLWHTTIQRAEGLVNFVEAVYSAPGSS